MSLTRITDDMRGAYCFRTSSGTLYRIDLDSRCLVRLKSDQAPTQDYADLAVSDLRRDGDEIPLLAVVQLEIGERGHLFLDIRGDGVATFRDTTPVISIQQLADRP
ncbi:hypothetical protein [Arthrobacter sp. 162MFSha1.1]|uniref:hypothetical protein n=1 Tax=Arthrobacter sp. 162MFSha1.1 TaxID=1151119 RepID=UPI00035CCCD9|nr:hypothetical protein [Arthrobacter sp. 162MFSha1.1]